MIGILFSVILVVISTLALISAGVEGALPYFATGILCGIVGQILGAMTK